MPQDVWVQFPRSSRQPGLLTERHSIWESKVAFIPVPNVAQVTFNQTYLGQPVANVFHLNVGPGANAALLTNLGNTLMSWALNTYAPLKHIGWEVVGARVRRLDTDQDIAVDVVPAAPIAGALQGTPLPGSIALCVSLRTALTGKSRRGRWYCTGHTAAQLTADSNIFTTQAVTDHVAALNALRGLYLPLTSPMVIVSRFTGGNPRTQGIFTQVTNCISTDTTVDSQRGRTR